MTQHKHPIQQKLANLKEALDADPTNVEVANRYWDGLGTVGGKDVRSGGFIRETFRRCAIASPEGVIAYARAYRDLYESTGEKPRADLFDEELLLALKTRLHEISKEDGAIVEWILASIS